MKINKILPKLKEIVSNSSSGYLTGEELEKKLSVSRYTICKAIRLLREQGIGIMTTKNGYILSTYAKPQDDVNYLRILLARRTSDYYSLRASMPEIKDRWNKIEGGSARLLRLIEAPIISGSRLFAPGVKALLTASNTLKI